VQENELLLKPMQRVLVSDEIIEQIKNLILEGKLRPGDQLPSETKMASQMKVGRSTIREALKVLIHLGFIERKNKVTVISDRIKGKLSPHDLVERFKNQRNILEMIEFRKIVEPNMASLAAIRSDTTDVSLLQRDVSAMTESIDEPEVFLKHDHHFHLHIAQGAKNQILIEVIQGIQHILEKTQGHIIRKSTTISPRSLEFHRNIFNAIKKSKPEVARKQMYEHLLDIEREVYTILKQENITENVD
jgi:GntR family transcriptional repressor for pyruvate dehydrogenase complex